MQVLNKSKAILGTIGMSVLLLSGCAATNPYTGQTQTSDATKGAGIGAVGGAVVGAIAGGERGALIGGAIGALTGGLIGNQFDKENAELRNALVGTGVQVRQNGDSLQLVMASDVSFPTNQASVRASFYPALNSVAMVLKKYNNSNISIVGYTDNVGSSAYNQKLSEMRAASVGAYLASQGISYSRIMTQGMGDRNPVASNGTAQGRAMNRRVEINLH
jgi:outer membrane protein OmpA-like peptidoglycan-associated protein